MPTVPSDAPPVTPTPTQEEGGGNPAPGQAAAAPTDAVEFILWNGSLPAPLGPMAKRFAKTSVTQQKKDATDLLKFLQEEEPDLAKLNVD